MDRWCSLQNIRTKHSRLCSCNSDCSRLFQGYIHQYLRFTTEKHFNVVSKLFNLPIFSIYIRLFYQRNMNYYSESPKFLDTPRIISNLLMKRCILHVVLESKILFYRCSFLSLQSRSQLYISRCNPRQHPYSLEYIRYHQRLHIR